MSLRFLNLSLSSRCGANCAFCPNGKHARREPVTRMSAALAEKIVREASAYPIERVDIGETGDAFLNPEALDILRVIRRHSQAAIRVFTNFQTFSPPRMDAVLGEGLLDQVVTNVDGASERTYAAAKGMPLAPVEEHIRYFLRRRQAAGTRPVSFRIQSLTVAHYTGTVRRVLGRPPLYVEAKDRRLPDDFRALVRKWREHGLTPTRSFVSLWAEKDGPLTRRFRVRRWLYARVLRRGCRLLPRLETSCFVAPDGRVYGCCADFDFATNLGDLSRQSLPAVIAGAPRADFLRRVRQRRFHEVGEPCVHWPLCQAF